MHSYCVSCRKNTLSKTPSASVRLMLVSNCAIFGKEIL